MKEEGMVSPNGLPAAAVRAAERPQPAAADGALGASSRARAAGPTSVGFAPTLLDFGLPSAPSSWRKAAQLDGSGERAEKRERVRDS